MQIAFIHAKSPGSVDITLNELAAALAGTGARLVGVLQEPSVDGDRHRCDMDLIEIVSGARLPISQKLGGGSRGCRLDPGAIETIAARVATDLRTGRADLLIVNRFGKLEAAGRGFYPVIADALEQDVPVVVGVNDLNRSAFDAFAAGIATELPDVTSTVLAWVLPLLRKAAA